MRRHTKGGSCWPWGWQYCRNNNWVAEYKSGTPGASRRAIISSVSPGSRINSTLIAGRSMKRFGPSRSRISASFIPVPRSILDASSWRRLY